MKDTQILVHLSSSDSASVRQVQTVSNCSKLLMCDVRTLHVNGDNHFIGSCWLSTSLICRQHALVPHLWQPERPNRCRASERTWPTTLSIYRGSKASEHQAPIGFAHCVPLRYSFKKKLSKTHFLNMFLKEK